MTTLAIFSNLMSQADWRTGHKEVPALRLTDLDVAHPHPHPLQMRCDLDVDVDVAVDVAWMWTWRSVE